MLTNRDGPFSAVSTPIFANENTFMSFQRKAYGCLAKEEEEGSENQLKLLEAAKTQLDISNNKTENAEAHLNLAAIAAMKYDWNLAYEHVLNAEKLDLLLKIRDNEIVNWSGKFRPDLVEQAVYPRRIQNSP